jgi:hypothetical protein
MFRSRHYWLSELARLVQRCKNAEINARPAVRRERSVNKSECAVEQIPNATAAVVKDAGTNSSARHQTSRYGDFSNLKSITHVHSLLQEALKSNKNNELSVFEN